MNKWLYRWTRDLHNYAGLFLSPLIVLYAVTAIVLNHRWISANPPVETTTRENLLVPPEEDGFLLAADVMEQVGVVGEIAFVRRQPQQHRIVVSVIRPDGRTLITVDTGTNGATVAYHPRNATQAMNFLHMMPGQHLSDRRGNWLTMRVWYWLADATVYLTLFLTVTGIYLWVFLRAERRTGLIFLGAGMVTLALMVFGLLA